MSSSTSSFKTELKVVLFVALLLLACEAGVRVVEPRLSLDIQHIRQLPAVAQRLAGREGLAKAGAATGGAAQRVLFIGNSQLRVGIDPEVIAGALDARGEGPVRVERVHPDGTALPDWYYAYKHYFADAGLPPDVLVVCFADNHLQDSHPVNPVRLARYYSSPRDIPEIFGRDLPSFDAQAEYLIASASAAFANRERVRTRVLDLLVPGYRDGAQRINQGVRRPGRESAQPAPTYERLKRLLALARAENVSVVLLAMPQPNVYELDEGLLRTAREAGASLVDCRRVEGVGRESFVDEMHLSGAGARAYSLQLGRLLAEVIPPPRKDVLPASAHSRR